MAQSVLAIGETSVRQLDGLFSLNDLHAAAGGEAKHQPAFFIRNEQTQALITEISSANLQTLKTVVGKGKEQGTYACRELVIAYAAWISAAFHLKVIRVFLAQQDQTASQTPSLTSRRWLVSFDHLGREHLQPIDWDDALLKYADLPKLLKAPDNMIETELLANIIKACTERLQARIDGFVQSDKLLRTRVAQKEAA